MKKISWRICAVLAAMLLPCAGADAQEAADTPPNPFANDPAAPAAGMVVFNATCSACHGAGATGGRGPALDTGSFSHASSDYDLFELIRSGIAGTGMPPFDALPADDVWRLITYLKSLAGSPAAGETPTGNPAAGETVFFGPGGCAACHEIDGRGADFAADLSAEGVRPLAAIRNGVLHRNLRLGPERIVDVVMKDGRSLGGLVRNEDGFTLHLETRDGRYLMLDKKDIDRIDTTGPAAPQDVATRLSPATVDDLVAYLFAHKARDFAQTAKADPAPVLASRRIADSAAEPQNWLTYWGDYRGRHFSELQQIGAANVAGLQARWAAPLLGSSLLESEPLVVDGVMYVSGPPGDVYALDARTGLEIWRFHRKQDVTNPYEINPFNKGVAVLDGRVFFGTLDNNLIALDAHTGRELWEKRIADTMEGYTITGAPLPVKNMLIVGMSGGEMALRGFLDAYDPATGRRLWRFYTVPGPGDPGNQTWAGDSWKYGAAATWLTGSYDAETDTLYWPTGNPAPDYNPGVRAGDNLYSDCVLALDPDTGKLKWYYQFTPNDGHDWDSTEDLVLADQMIDGKLRKLILHADRNGMFYVLDRSNGKFLWSKPFVHVTWNKGFDAMGHAIVDPESVPTPGGKVVYPSGAATNFQAPSYDRLSGILYLEYNDAQGFVASGPAVRATGQEYLGRGTAIPPPAPPPEHGVMALDTATGRVVWKFPLLRGSNSSGLLATRGGLVFAATAEGQFIALDMKTGKPLWHFETGGPITASPMSYAVDGKQFVAVSAGNTLYAFALPDETAAP